MKKCIWLLIIMLVTLFGLSSCGSSSSSPGGSTPTTHSVYFAMYNNSGGNQVGVSYTIHAAGANSNSFTEVQPNSEWVSSIYSIQSDYSVDFSGVCNNENQSGTLIAHIMVDGNAWKSVTINSTYHATFDIQGTLP
jgi:hypothetical protein